MRIICRLVILLWVLLTTGNVLAGPDGAMFRLPPKTTNAEALTAVSHAAIQRKWEILNIDNNKLRIRIDHQNRLAVLEFSVSANMLVYNDLTAEYESKDEFSLDYHAVRAPERWINYLRQDAEKFMETIYRISSVNKRQVSERDGDDGAGNNYLKLNKGLKSWR